MTAKVFRFESVREKKESREEIRKGKDESMGVHPSLESICLSQPYVSKYFNALGDFSTRVRDEQSSRAAGGRKDKCFL